ncbi:MAG: DUF2971 domain-containing protein [Eubacterium sp.]|nr:DUF2971 domain-containing protein [Eubacterium sp.]
MGKICTLYKYCPLNEDLIKIIESNRLRMSDGINFNDPFDLVVANKNSMKQEKIKGIRVLCLTNSYENKMMWAHYSDGHKGVCLTIELDNIDDIYPVIYTRERVFTDTNIEEVIKRGTIKAKRNLKKSYDGLVRKKKIALLKSKSWMYECEYRIIEFPEDCHKDVYRDVNIKNVYLGVNVDSSSKDYNDLIELCGIKNITVKQMEMSKKCYRIQYTNREGRRL